LTPVPFGNPEFVKSVRELEKDFYLVEQPEGQYFATVTDDSLELQPLGQTHTEKSFQLDDWIFIRGNDLAEEL